MEIGAINLKSLVAKGFKVVVASTLGVVACALAYTTSGMAWLALGMGVLAAAVVGWKLLAPARTVPIAGMAAAIDQQIVSDDDDVDLQITHAGELVDMNTAYGQGRYAQDLMEN